MRTRSPSASSPTRPGAPSRTPARTRASAISAQSTAPRREAATSSRWPPTGSSSSTTAPARCRCRRSRSSACCPAPVDWCAWSTSARCAATGRTSSPPPRKGVRGRRAVDWGLVDEIAPSSRFEAESVEGARAGAGSNVRSPGRSTRHPSSRDLERRIDGRAHPLPHTWRPTSIARFAPAASASRGPVGAPPADVDGLVEAGDAFWPLALAREIEDLVLHLRHNEPEIGTLVVASEGEPGAVADHDRLPARAPRALARPRDPALLETPAEARRPDLAQPRRPGRAGELLRRLPAGARARGGPRLHAGRAVRGRRRGGRGASHRSPTSAASRAPTA